jgi:hypothetical protein
MNSDPKGEHGDRQNLACTCSTSEAGGRSNSAGQEDSPRDVARRTGFLEPFGDWFRDRRDEAGFSVKCDGNTIGHSQFKPLQIIA